MDDDIFIAEGGNNYLGENMIWHERACCNGGRGEW